MKHATIKDILAECSCSFREEFNTLPYDTILKDIRRILLHIKNLNKKVCSISYEDVVFRSEKISLDIDELSLFYSMLHRYRKHEPISKIINKKSFWKHDFYVNADVLDPRQETELIIESVLTQFKSDASINFLDIGTGSGCILLSLLSEFKNAVGVGIDISNSAIDVTNYNKKTLEITRAEFINIGWKDLALLGNNTVSYHSKLMFDVIVSNPPYIKSSDILLLDENVRNYDPLIALDGGDDGLMAYREIVNVVKTVLNPKGAIFFEVGYAQASSVATILREQCFSNINIVKDLSGIDRVVFAYAM